MEVNGRVIKVLPERSGTAKNGEPWKMQDYVIAIDLADNETYQRHMTFTVSDGKNKRIMVLDIKEGKHMTFFFNINASEYNEKWYNHVECYMAREIKE
jgi:hypothetical protein